MIDVHTWSAGSVQHLERIVVRDGALRLRTLPARFGIVEHPDGPVVFDTGYHPSLRSRLVGIARAYHRIVPWRCAPDQTVGARLHALGYRAADVRCVVLSHMHADHVAGLIDLPGVPVVLTRAAWDSLQSGARIPLGLQGYFPELLPPDLPDRAEWTAPPPPSDDLEASAVDLLGDGTLGVVSLPGHAPGQIGLWVRPARALFVADATFSRAAVHTGVSPSRAFMAAVHHDADATRRTLSHLRAWVERHPGLQIIACHAWEGPEEGRLA